MTRKRAILALLGVAGTFRIQGQTPSSSIKESGREVSTDADGWLQFHSPPSEIYLRVELGDQADGSSITHFEVHYNGETRTLAAAEIWEALQS